MKINLSNPQKMQILHGWGTSACWWSQYCSEPETQDKIVSLLYGSDGLGLNIYRYNIGGGTDEGNCRVPNPWRRSESFLLYDREEEKSSWKFSLDKNAVEVMKKSLATGNVDTLILFCNSPHYSQTASGQASGALIGHTCNLPKMNYRKFADVLRVAQHFIDCGLPVKYISPINEPQWKWGGTDVWQEGCHYEKEELVEIYHIFAEEILQRNMSVRLYGPESGCMLEDTYDYIKALTADELMSVLDVFAYHSYHNDNNPSARYEFKQNIVSKYSDFRFDMSEWCELPNKSHTKNFKGALITARIIGQDLIYGGAESWTSWVAVNQFSIKEDGFDYSDGLITANDDFSDWYIAQRYYGFAHFSKFVPVGSTVLVIVNEGDTCGITIDGDFSSMKIIKSTQNIKLEDSYNGNFKNQFDCEGNSILTVVLK